MTLSPLERLERMRQGLKNSAGGGGDKSYFTFWTMQVGSYAIVRLLPDRDENNPFPWVEKLAFNWKFADPENPGQELSVKVPCRETWDGPKSCEVTNELRALFKTKDPADEKLARAYWPKRSFLYQGFARKNPISENEAPENPIRLLAINKQIHAKIKDTILESDPALAMFKDAGPDDFTNGRDFIIKKTQGPMYTDWGQSSWAQQTSALTDDEANAVEKFGLFDLKEKLGTKPTPEAFIVIKQMFEASLSGKPWDKSWETHFKPQRNKDAKSASDPDDHAEASGDAARATKPPGTNALKSDVMARIRGAVPAPKPVQEAAPPLSSAIVSPPAAGGSAIERLRAARAAKAG